MHAREAGTSAPARSGSRLHLVGGAAPREPAFPSRKVGGTSSHVVGEDSSTQASMPYVISLIVRVCM